MKQVFNVYDQLSDSPYMRFQEFIRKYEWEKEFGPQPPSWADTFKTDGDNFFVAAIDEKGFVPAHHGERSPWLATCPLHRWYAEAFAPVYPMRLFKIRDDGIEKEPEDWGAPFWYTPFTTIGLVVQQYHVVACTLGEKLHAPAKGAMVFGLLAGSIDFSLTSEEHDKIERYGWTQAHQHYHDAAQLVAPRQGFVRDPRWKNFQLTE